MNSQISPPGPYTPNRLHVNTAISIRQPVSPISPVSAEFSASQLQSQSGSNENLQPPPQTLSDKLTNYGTQKLRTVSTEIGPQLPSFNLPRRLFRWLYSVSLIILTTLLLAFISVTPIDVIVQTSSAASSGVKLFIVIIVCVVFVVVSFLLYFQRIYQHRVSMNDIPYKSVYVPYENDLPKPVYRYIERRLKQCQATRIEAGPLNHRCVTINHPGLSPPIYVQERNTGNEGNLLPPNLLYEDIIYSLGDKFNFSEGFKSQISLPKHYTFRDIIIHLCRVLIDEKAVKPHELPDVNQLLMLYEKFKFGPSLIKENEMVEFMVIFTKISGLLLDKVGSVFSTRRKKFTRKPRSSFVDRSGSSYSNSRSDFHYYYSDDSEDLEYDEDHLDREIDSAARSPFGIDNPNAYYPHRSSSYTKNSSRPSSSRLTGSELHGSTESIGSIARRTTSHSSDGSVVKKKVSVGSVGSVIRKKLSISEDIPRRDSAITFDLDPHTKKGDFTKIIPDRRSSYNSVNTGGTSGYSGHSKYSSEQEHAGPEFVTPERNYRDNDIFQDETSDQDSEEDTSIYNFRPSRKSSTNPKNHSIIPQFKFEPSSPVRSRAEERSSSPSRLRDIEIKRSKSPKKRKLKKPKSDSENEE